MLYKTVWLSLSLWVSLSLSVYFLPLICFFLKASFLQSKQAIQSRILQIPPLPFKDHKNLCTACKAGPVVQRSRPSCTGIQKFTASEYRGSVGHHSWQPLMDLSSINLNARLKQFIFVAIIIFHGSSTVFCSISCFPSCQVYTQLASLFLWPFGFFCNMNKDKCFPLQVPPEPQVAATACLLMSSDLRLPLVVEMISLIARCLGNQHSSPLDVPFVTSLFCCKFPVLPCFCFLGLSGHVRENTYKCTEICVTTYRLSIFLFLGLQCQMCPPSTKFWNLHVFSRRTHLLGRQQELYLICISGNSFRCMKSNSAASYHLAQQDRSLVQTIFHSPHYMRMMWLAQLFLTQ